jgi:hypothetical protein
MYDEDGEQIPSPDGDMCHAGHTSLGDSSLRGALPYGVVTELPGWIWVSR